MTDTERKIEALHKAADGAPEYAVIAPFFETIYRFIQGREDKTGISVDLTAVNRTERTGSGFPLISPAELRIDQEALAAFLVEELSVLEHQSREGELHLQKMARAVASGKIDLRPLVSAVLERRRGPLEDTAKELEVPTPLLEYVLEIPLKTALELVVAAIPSDYFPGWQENVCPVCGGRAAMAELVGEEGRRRLSCSSCWYTWTFKRLKCPSCGCEDADKLSYFTAGEEGMRVDTCRACSRYIKTRDVRKRVREVPLEVEDLLTIHLDLLASREGFERGT